MLAGVATLAVGAEKGVVLLLRGACVMAGHVPACLCQLPLHLNKYLRLIFNF